MKCNTCGKELIGKQTKFCSGRCKNQDTNHKHQDYECQKKRGMTRKIELVKMLGGKCSCGYNKNYAALEFHHEKNKEFNLDIRKLSNSKWEDCVEEAKKCKLLCSNCHREHHNPDCQL